MYAALENNYVICRLQRKTNFEMQPQNRRPNSHRWDSYTSLLPRIIIYSHFYFDNCESQITHRSILSVLDGLRRMVCWLSISTTTSVSSSSSAMKKKEQLVFNFSQSLIKTPELPVICSNFTTMHSFLIKIFLVFPLMNELQKKISRHCLFNLTAHWKQTFVHWALLHNEVIHTNTRAHHSKTNHLAERKR